MRQLRPGDERSFRSEPSHATVAFCPWNPSALYYFAGRGLNSILFFQRFWLTLQLSRFPDFSPYGKRGRVTEVQKL